MLKRAVCIGLMTLAAGCGTTDSGDDIAELACSRFRAAMGDASTLTDAELRERLQDVHRLARLSESQSLESASRTALEEATRGTPDGMLAALQEVSGECQALGY